MGRSFFSPVDNEERLVFFTTLIEKREFILKLAVENRCKMFSEGDGLGLPSRYHCQMGMFKAVSICKVREIS
jgi:hypothetical protein